MQLGKRPGAVAAVRARLTTEADPADRRRLGRILLAMRTPEAALALEPVIGDLAGDDLVAATRRLRETGDDGTAALARLAADTRLGDDTRIAVIRQLVELSSPASTLALLDAAVAAPAPAVADALARALTGRPLPRLLEAAATAPTAPVLWRAITTAAARAAADERARAIAAMIVALDAVGDFIVEGTLARGLATLGDGDTLTRLDAWLAARPPGARTIALRTVAARALGDNPSAPALEHLARAARDADAGVRLAALAGLDRLAPADGAGPAWTSADGAARRAAADRAIGELLTGDEAWPEIRRGAASALGARCDAPDPAARLAQAVDRDPDVTVAGAALASLVQCRADGVARRLIDVAADGERALPLRVRALELVPALGDRAVVLPSLLDLVRGWRRSAFEARAARELARRGLIALGRLGGDGVADELIAALGDGAAPEIAAAAAIGLGAMGPACPATAAALLADLSTSGSPEVAAAARSALPRCRGQ
ncbi:MAG: hypothetical protein R2939_12955 [Kofleriaceae bacterium]